MQEDTLKKSRPPQSDVAESTGIVGLAALTFSLGLIFLFQKDLPVVFKALEVLGITGISMLLYELIRLKTYSELTQQLKQGLIKSTQASPSHLLIRLLGGVATLIPFAFGYFILKEVMPDRYESILIGFLISLPIVLICLAFYFFITSSEKDVYWHIGMVILKKEGIKDVSEAPEHWRQWMLKAFFIPFMFGIVYGNITLLDLILKNFSFGFFHFFFLLHMIVFVTDTVFGTIGYVASFRVTGSHIRSTQNTILGWAVCLICYPPFLLILFSFADFQDSITWEKWLGNAGFLAWAWAGALLVFELLYLWATIIFGIRFSNLTNRGIITNGPYRYFKHPAYFSKNIAWWLLYIPFVPIISLAVAAINSAQLLFVNYIYYLRAKTEERHLMEDPDYRTYVEWIDEHGILPSIRRAIAKSAAGRITAQLATPVFSRFSYAYEKYMPFKHVIRHFL